MSLASMRDQRMAELQQFLDKLSPRDRMALIILTIFLLVTIVGYGLWALHRAANNAQTEATEARELLLWMRSQAPNIRQSQSDQMPLNQIIQTAAQNQGLAVSQMPSGDNVQVSMTNPNFAVLGTWLSRLAEQGVSIQQMDISQNTAGELELKALLGQGG